MSEVSVRKSGRRFCSDDDDDDDGGGDDDDEDDEDDDVACEMCKCSELL